MDILDALAVTGAIIFPFVAYLYWSEWRLIEKLANERKAHAEKENDRD